MGNTKELCELLEQVNLAIANVLVGGQSVRLGSRQVTRADLAELKTLRADLEGQIAADKSGHLLDRTVVAYFEGR